MVWWRRNFFDMYLLCMGETEETPIGVSSVLDFTATIDGFLECFLSLRRSASRR